MYWEEKGEGDEDLIYPPHVLTFATKKYNFAARPYYEEYLFDSEGNLQFVYGYNPMWAPDESAEDEQYEFRFYLNKGKLIKAVIKKRADDKQPYKEVFSGTALKGSFSKEFSTYKANADAAHQRIDIVEADRVQTNNSYGGDPFPGTSRVTTFDFMNWAHANIFSFDLVEETDTTVNFLLARTDYTPSQPQIVVEQVLGTSLTFTWGAVADAREYLVTVEQIKDGMPAVVDGFDHNAYIQPEVVQVTGLSPMTQYRITIVSRIASYESEPAIIDVTTTDIQFVETAPVATPATQISATGFTAHWLPLDGAEEYRVTVYSNVYSDTIIESYGFDTKAEGMPMGWSTNSTQYSSVMFGESKPSLQLNKQDDFLSFDYGDNMIVSLSFWQRSQMSSNQLVIEQRDGDEWIQVHTLNASSQGAKVTVPIDSAAQVRIRFERKGSYVVLDDVEVNYITLDQSPVDGFVDMPAGNETSLAVQELPLATSYLYRVRGIQDGQASALSNAILVMMGHGLPGDVNGDHEVNIADVNAVIDMILSGKFINNGDVNNDNEVNIADINAIIDIILNQ